MAVTSNSKILPQTPAFPVGQTILTANTAKDGTGTVVTLFTADATNGGFVDGVYVAYTGTSTATVLRIFVNNGSTNATAGNNTLLKSITVAANTLSEVAAALDFFTAFGPTSTGLPLPAGYKINATIGTTVAAALSISCSGGQF